MSDTIPLPNSDGSIWVNGAVKSGYTFQTMKDYAAAVSADKDARIKELEARDQALSYDSDMLRERIKVLEDALWKAVVQNEHDMLMTGEELRAARATLGTRND